MFRDDFDGDGLDRSVWLPHYLPAWSSRAATLASHRLEDGRLVLDVPVDHPVWCPDDHAPPLRVSGIQSGSWSGPVGSTRGPAAVRRRPDGQGGAAALRGVAAGVRARRDPVRDGPVAPVDGRPLDGGVRGRRGAAALRRALRRRGLRQRARGRAPRRWAWASRRSATRRSPRTSRLPGSTSTCPGSTPTPSTGTPTSRCSPSTARSCVAARARRRTRCSSWSRSSTSRADSTGDDHHLVPRLVVDHVAGW